MRVLFTSVPAYGHLLPMLPLARAAQAAGIEVAVSTAAVFADVAAPLPLLAAGPTLLALAEETYRRTQAPPITGFDPAAFGELFGAVRIDFTYPQALAVGREWRPDLVIAEREDFVGPMVAAALGVPWARFLIGVDFPTEVTAAITARARQRWAAAGLDVSAPVATIDPWPVALQPAGWRPTADRIVIRPEPHTSVEQGPVVEPSAGRRKAPVSARRSKVLVTTGTIADDVATVAAVVDALVALDVDVVVTGRHGQPWPLKVDPSRVRQVGFEPLARLLDGVDVAVVAGGAGTVVGALARGVPLVVLPLVFDQRENAERAGAVGAAVIAEDPGQVPAAVHRVLTDPSVRRAAQALAGQIAAMDPPDEAWRRLAQTTSTWAFDHHDRSGSTGEGAHPDH